MMKLNDIWNKIIKFIMITYIITILMACKLFFDVSLKISHLPSVDIINSSYSKLLIDKPLLISKITKVIVYSLDKKVLIGEDFLKMRVIKIYKVKDKYSNKEQYILLIEPIKLGENK